MSKEDYNIDNILSEVKKRREAPEEPSPQPAAEEAAEEVTKETAEEAAPEEAPETPAAESLAEEPAEEAPEAESEADGGEELPEESEEDAEGMVNLLALAEEAEEEEAEEEEETEKPEGEEAPKKKKSKKKIIISIICILLAAVIIAGAYFGITVYNWTKQIAAQSQEGIYPTEMKDMDELVENFSAIKETEADELSSLEDMIKTWYYNGDPCYSSHVLNVLLIGEDTRGKKILEDETRADAAIIASVNVDTEEINLTSILRDSWAYWETVPGDKSTGEFGKLNGAMSTGDLKVYINSIERLYKIKIDGYAIVNFTSFEKIIDALYPNGIELTLTSAEINEINNHQSRYGKVTIEKTFEGNSGKIRLNGKQALAYCRIRHIDTDNARADRQKTTLMQIYKDFKDAKLNKKLKLVEELVPYVKTGFNQNDIIKVAKDAFTKGWTNYDIASFNYPAVNVVSHMANDYGKQWIWKADFPADAYDMQKRIYGKSCITLAHKRIDMATINQSGFYADGAYPTEFTYENSKYGEETTVAVKEEDE